MIKEILVLDANQKSCRQFCELLQQQQYSAIAMHSLEGLEDRLAEQQYLAVFIDIDTIKIDNRTVRKLTLNFPAVYFFCLSQHPFHPELEDAICYHIYACLKKPVDPEELTYWIKSIYQEENIPDT